jgi:hypothetical protein
MSKSALLQRTIRHMLNLYDEPRLRTVSEQNNKSRWLWSLSLVATSLAGAAVYLFRGCWHNKMSWPVRSQGYSYQVCTNCGIKRLFDEKEFRSYGPYSYDLERLIALEFARRQKAHQDVA